MIDPLNLSMSEISDMTDFQIMYLYMDTLKRREKASKNPGSDGEENGVDGRSVKKDEWIKGMKAMHPDAKDADLDAAWASIGG